MLPELSNFPSPPAEPKVYHFNYRLDLRWVSDDTREYFEGGKTAKLNAVTGKSFLKKDGD